MTTRDHTRVVLDLVPSREPISGHLRDETGAVRCFDGWLDLAALLDAAHHECPPRVADTTRVTRPTPRATADHPGRAPGPRHRVALVTWLGIWPLVSVALGLVAPRLGMLPFLVRTALIAALVVAAMTYLVMPGFARVARIWPTLLRQRRSAHAELARR
jgi:hypothetical protein